MKLFARRLLLACGLISAVAHADETITYVYDARGRLIQVSHSGAVNQGATASYNYDLADNRTNVTVVTSWTSRALRTGDFNGDGRGDIFWRDDGSSGANSPGTFTDWLSNTAGGWTDNWANSANLVDMTWHIAGFGDFNGDGRSDILWRDDSGAISDWLANPNGGFADNGTFSYANPGPTWHIVGVGDFNGDGKADILWRNDNGYISEWLGSSAGNGAFVDNGAIAGTGAADNTWHIVGIGDFNGDGRSDILLRNDSGVVAEWTANPDGSFTSNPTVSYGVDLSWKIVGVGDFNCDGRADILWRNDNGDLSQWQAKSNGDGSFVTEAMPYYTVPTNYRVALIGDFDGNRCDDILLRDTAGNINAWYGTSTGAFTMSSNGADAAVPTNWNIEPR